MRIKTISKRYAQALLEIALEKDKASEYSKQLETIDNSINNTAILHYAWYENQLSKLEKKRIIKDFFADKVDSTLVDFLFLLIDKKRESFFKAIAEEYMDLADIKEDFIEISVGSAVELSEKDIEKLKNKLASMTGKKVRLEVKVIPEIIGGLILKIGDEIIDNSVVKRLSSMGKELEGSGYYSDDYLKRFLFSSKDVVHTSESDLVADVTTSIALSEDRKQELEKKLSEKMGQKVIIHAKIDESLLGGITVKIGDNIIDGSGRKRLHLLADKMEKVIGNWGEE